MTSSKRAAAASQVKRLGDGWSSFWFSVQPAYTLGLVRMAFGALTVYVALDLLTVVPLLYSKNGPVPVQPTAQTHLWINTFQVGLFQLWTSDTAILIGWAVLLLAAISLTVGWHSQLSALIVWVLWVSFIRRSPGIANAADFVMSNTALILAISACGAALSLDQRRRTGRFWSAEDRLGWPIRLLQVQLSLIYFFTAQTKLIGTAWTDGSAVSYPWRIYRDWAILPAPEWVSNSPFLVNVATWGTMAIELALALLVWNPRLRYWVLGAGVVLHVLIWLNLAVIFFGLAMFVLYVAWVPWETARDLPDRVKYALGRRFKRFAPAEPQSFQPSGPTSASAADVSRGRP